MLFSGADMPEGVHYVEKALEFAFGRSKRDKDAARLVIAALNARDTVHAQTCNEHCRATYESVRGLRDVVNGQIGKDISTELAFVLRELETACREYMRAMERTGLYQKSILSRGPEMDEFARILGEFQHSAQNIGARLAKQYKIVLP
jgi:hypothetical protein